MRIYEKIISINKIYCILYIFIYNSTKYKYVLFYIFNKNIMNFNKLTIKASEAIQEANSICSSRENSQISTEHLFYAMIEQNDWYLPAILRKLNANKEQIKAETLLLIDALPRIQWSSQIALSSELNKILEDSERNGR